jgi:hypothetical protein
LGRWERVEGIEGGMGNAECGNIRHGADGRIEGGKVRGWEGGKVEFGSWNSECGKKRMRNKLKSEFGMGKAEI